MAIPIRFKQCVRCGELFEPVRRQKYCGALCRDRTKMERFIERCGGSSAYAAYRAQGRRDRLWKKIT